MLWVIAAILIAFCAYWFLFKQSDETSPNHVESQGHTSSSYVKPSTIYEAVTQFSAVCKTCKERTRWAYDERDNAHLRITGNEQQVQLQCTCFGDCIAIHLGHVCTDIGFSKESDNCISYNATFPISISSIDTYDLQTSFTRGNPNTNYKPQRLKPDGSIWLFFDFS